jgi:hypothetical protein
MKKWRSRLVLLLGLLLPVPLIATSFGWLMAGGPGRPEVSNEGRRLVPWIPLQEQRQRPTFLRPCRGDEECDAPLICLRGVPLVTPYCTASECMTARECEEGFTCRSLEVGPHVVRLCGLEGRAKEGERCWKLPTRQESGCEPGLVCASDWCARPCQPQEPGSCPQGYSCGGEDVEGPACLPSCEGQPCPEGQHCVRLKHGASLCARVLGTDCQREPCPEEQVCSVALSERHEREVRMRCVRPCGEQGPPCPEGVCAAGHCLQRCEPGVPGTCGPEEKCVESRRHAPGVCLLDLSR